jgi:hypothetical protein
MTGLGILLAVALFTAVVKGAQWLAARGIEDGDLPMDALSAIGPGPDRTLLVEVSNPSGTEVAVGCGTRRQMAPGRVRRLIPALVIRPATRTERRRLDRGASHFLGAVEAGSTRTWRIPSPLGPSRCFVFLGQPGGRLRVHDHAVPQVRGPWSIGPGAPPDRHL